MSALRGTYRFDAPCAHCGRMLSAATAFRPDEKDQEVLRSVTPHAICLCAFCHEWIVVNQAGTGYRTPTHAEYETIVADKNLTRLRRAVVLAPGPQDVPPQTFRGKAAW